MNQIFRHTKPRFLWTGLLILLPVIGLGVVAISQLRQDRVVAMEEARREAHDHAKVIASSLGGIPIGGLEIRARLDNRGIPASWQPFTDPPTPPDQPDKEALEFEKLLKRKDLSPVDLMDALGRITHTRGVLTRAGLPVETEAKHHLLQVAIEHSEPIEKLEKIAEDLARISTVLYPSSQTPTYLQTAAPFLARGLEEHQARWEAVSKAQRLTIELKPQIKEFISQLDETYRQQGWNVMRYGYLPEDPTKVYAIDNQSGQRDYTFYLFALDELRRSVVEKDRWRDLPKEYGARFWLEGRILASQRSEQDDVVLAAYQNPRGQAWVEITLADPEPIYGPIASRTRDATWLIVLAALAAAVGWWAAWRAFLQQGRLVRMKDNFVSAVSHELKAPIGAIGLMAEELENGAYRDAEKQKEYARVIACECTRLGSLVQNVLDYARIESGRESFEFEEADLGELTRASAEVLRPAAQERGMSIEAEAPPAGDLCAVVDAPAIGRVLVNLLDNAIKYGPADTVVRLVAEPAGDEGFRLTVSNSGEPIPADQRQRIFAQFVRGGSELTRETKGVGIGLSLVRHIADAHGGKVWVESDASGNHFHFERPARNSVSRPESTPTSPPRDEERPITTARRRPRLAVRYLILILLLVGIASAIVGTRSYIRQELREEAIIKAGHLGRTEIAPQYASEIFNVYLTNRGEPTWTVFAEDPKPPDSPSPEALELARLIADRESPPLQRSQRLEKLAYKRTVSVDGLPMSTESYYYALLASIEGGEKRWRVEHLARGLQRECHKRSPSFKAPIYMEAAAPYLSVAELEEWRRNWRGLVSAQRFLEAHGPEIEASVETIINRYQKTGWGGVSYLFSDSGEIPMLLKIAPNGNDYTHVKFSGIPLGEIEPALLRRNHSWRGLPAHLGARHWIAGQLVASTRADPNSTVLGTWGDSRESSQVEIVLASTTMMATPAALRASWIAMLLVLAIILAVLVTLAKRLRRIKRALHANNLTA